MNEMRDIGPVDAIVVGERDGRPQAVGLHPHPNITQFIDCQLAAPASVVDRRFKLVKSDLPDHRVQHVLDLAGDEDPPPDRVGFAG